MAIDGLDDAAIRDILLRTRRIAVVGASADPMRPSFGVMRFLLEQGFEVIPVNPGLAGRQVLGQGVVAGLADAGRLDMVDVFRASEHVAALMEAAIRLGAHTVWTQLGVVDEVAAARGRTAGLRVAMDRCPVIEWRRLRLRAGRRGA